MKYRRWSMIVILAAVIVVAAAIVFWRPSPEHQQRQRELALIAATKAGDLSAVRRALESGASASCRDGNGITALMYACRGDRPEIGNPAPTDYPEIVEALAEHGADVNAQTYSGFVALFWAVRYGHEGAARALIAHGANVNARDRDGLSALQWARTNHHKKIISILEEAGAKE